MAKQQTTYKGITQINIQGRWRWALKLKIDGKNQLRGSYADEREAAKAYDMHLIAKGEPPVNVLKKKENGNV